MDREFIYRALIRGTGEILESDNLKNLYCCLRNHLRSELGEVSKMEEYDNRFATIEYGILETSMVIDKPGYFHSEWYHIRTVGHMFIGMACEAFTRDSDCRECCYDRRTAVM